MGSSKAKESNGRNVGGVSLWDKVAHRLFGPKVPVEILVAHFTPSTFPLYPIISKKTTDLCRESWEKIRTADYTDENGTVTSGITMFYNAFYERLEQLDADKNFEAVLMRQIKGKNKISAKGAVLINLIKSVLKIENPGKWVEFGLHQLGKMHARMGIHPWQYAIYIETVLMTLSARLETDASHIVMEAWVNLFAYVMKHSMPIAIIRSKPHPLDAFHFQRSSESANAKINNNLVLDEEEREIITARSHASDKLVAAMSGRRDIDLSARVISISGRNGGGNLSARMGLGNFNGQLSNGMISSPSHITTIPEDSFSSIEVFTSPSKGDHNLSSNGGGGGGLYIDSSLSRAQMYKEPSFKNIKSSFMANQPVLNETEEEE
eukprot:gene3032-5945_t